MQVNWKCSASPLNTRREENCVKRIYVQSLILTYCSPKYKCFAGIPRYLGEYLGTRQGMVIVPGRSLRLTVNRSCQEQCSLSLNLWGLGQVTAPDSDQGGFLGKLLCRIDSAAIVHTFGTVELAHACATEVDPAPLLPLVQARTAFGGERQVLRIAFLACGLHLPSSPSFVALAVISSRSKPAHS